MRTPVLIHRLVLAAVLACAGAAHAANHALILSIGTYSRPDASLPGIDLDEANAILIAKTMGVPEANLVVLRNEALSGAGVDRAFTEAGDRMARGDNLFIYYSGHGTQRNARTSGAKCSEGMVTYDMKMYPDTRIQEVLAALSAKAGQLVFMNDSCFSGGQAEYRSIDGVKASDGTVAKTWKLPNESVEQTPGYTCGDAINAKMTRDILPVAKASGANMLYIAAAQDNEVAAATNKGSAATLAWLSCLKPQTDGNRSGTLSGEEIRSCAQAWMDRGNFKHHITLVGNKALPLSFVGLTSAQAAAQVQPQVEAQTQTQTQPQVQAQPQAALQSAAATLQDVWNGASPEIRVGLAVAKPRLKIEQDFLQFSVTSSKAGYLTILQVGSDGKTFNRLFPNDMDPAARIEAGTLQLPRASWMLHAGGPAGTSYLMAVVSDTPRDFARGMKAEGPFRSGTDSQQIFSAASGKDSAAPGRYGASDVVPIEEF